MSMKEVKVKRTELLAVIQKNREDHRAGFLKAQEGFRKRVIEELDTMLKEAREGQNYRLYVGLPQPEDKTKDYDRVIEMLRMSVDEIIEITQEEFAHFVLDQWQWKQNWSTTNSMYGA